MVLFSVALWSQQVPVDIIGPDANGVVWGIYTNKEYGFSMEYPYASTLSPYLVGVGPSTEYGTTTPYSLLIGFGAEINAPTPGLEYARPINPEMKGKAWRVLLVIEKTYFTSVDEWLGYHEQGYPPREIVEKETMVAGEKAYITYHFNGEFKGLASGETANISDDPLHTRVISVMHNGVLHRIVADHLSMEDTERIARSIAFVKN